MSSNKYATGLGGRLPDTLETDDEQEPEAVDSNAVSHVIVPAVVEFWRTSGGVHWVHTQGTSMLPLIRQGDRILVSSDLTAIRRGTIVVFLHKGRFIAHRVLRILPDSRVVTKGDNSWTFDLPTSTDDLVGHVLGVQRQGYFMRLDGPKWRAIGWGIATATVIVAVPYGWLRHLKQRLWGHRPLPGMRLLRRGSQAVLRAALKPFVWSSSHASRRRQS